MIARPTCNRDTKDVVAELNAMAQRLDRECQNPWSLIGDRMSCDTCADVVHEILTVADRLEAAARIAEEGTQT